MDAACPRPSCSTRMKPKHPTCGTPARPIAKAAQLSIMTFQPHFIASNDQLKSNWAENVWLSSFLKGRGFYRSPPAGGRLRCYGFSLGELSCRPSSCAAQLGFQYTEVCFWTLLGACMLRVNRGPANRRLSSRTHAQNASQFETGNMLKKFSPRTRFVSHQRLWLAAARLVFSGVFSQCCNSKQATVITTLAPH